MDEQQTTVPISDEIASLGRDPDIFAGYILDNPDPTLLAESRGKGLKLYDEVDRDPHAGSVLQTRYLAVAGEKWEVQPADESARSKEIAEFVTEALKHCNFGQAVGEMLQAILYGYYPAEVMWQQRQDGRIVVAKLRGKHPRRFAFTLERELRLLTKAAPRDGEAIPPRKFMALTWGDSDNPYGKGLGQRIWWSVWFKKHGIKFWLIFLDKFSMPTPIGKYPSGSTKEQKNTLLEAIQAIRTETGVTIPENMAIDLLEAARSGSVSYEEMCDYMDRQTSKAVLGQTLTTEVQGGSYAASQTHNEVRQEIKEADAGMVAELVNENLVRWLVDYNYAGVSLYPTFRYRTEKEQTLKELAERDKILVTEVGVQSDADYWYDTYNLPRPAGGAQVITPTAPAPAAMFAEQAPPARFTPPQQALEDMADTALAADHLAANEELIARAVENAASFEEAMEQLITLHPRLDMTKLQDDLAVALVNARLLGTKEVQDGIEQGFDLPMTGAEDFWRGKVQLGKVRSNRLSDEAKLRAFAVSGIAKGDELNTVFTTLQRAIENGESFDKFKKECREIFERRGWTGKRAWRVDNIFRTNIQTAYNVGHYEQLEADKDVLPYWQYSAVNDRRTRPTHLR